VGVVLAAALASTKASSAARQALSSMAFSNISQPGLRNSLELLRAPWLHGRQRRHVGAPCFRIVGPMQAAAGMMPGKSSHAGVDHPGYGARVPPCRRREGYPDGAPHSNSLRYGEDAFPNTMGIARLRARDCEASGLGLRRRIQDGTPKTRFNPGT
jgi:hypothetical protein